MLKFTFQVAYPGPIGHDVTTEVAVRAATLIEGRKLAAEVAERALIQRKITVQKNPIRIESDAHGQLTQESAARPVHDWPRL